eukprot:TRINITY_DN8218_c0_g1_i2.p1 TRINITY_DN8218_c0_g1~~TRINITY_DN8218_c0_g1_i2.p1  ORF type:complete len:203 (-),score=46.07 TRINITY_DN8218_c0_g1_i2:119-727(-)
MSVAQLYFFFGKELGVHEMSKKLESLGLLYTKHIISRRGRCAIVSAKKSTNEPISREENIREILIDGCDYLTVVALHGLNSVASGLHAAQDYLTALCQSTVIPLLHIARYDIHLVATDWYNLHMIESQLPQSVQVIDIIDLPPSISDLTEDGKSASVLCKPFPFASIPNRGAGSHQPFQCPRLPLSNANAQLDSIHGLQISD